MWKSICRTLCRFDAVCGRERALSAHVATYLSPFCDEVTVDALGNVIARRKKEGAKRLLLCTPLDECGFFVNEADEQGRLRVCTVGDFSPASYAYSHVRTERGAQGVLVPLTDAPTDAIADYAIDLGTTRRKDASRLAKAGDALCPVPAIKSLAGRRICGSGLESRLGVSLLLALAAQELDSPYDLTLLFYTQGQFGARGAGTAAFACEADVTVILDYATAKSPVRLGGGAVIRHRDKSAICDVNLTQVLVALARGLGLSYQEELGCDALSAIAPMQKVAGGRRVAALALPVAYRKTPTQTVAESDVAIVFRLLRALVQEPIL